MNIHKKSGQKIVGLLLSLIMALFCVACSSSAEEADNVKTTEVMPEEEQTVSIETDFSEEESAEEETQEPELESEEAEPESGTEENKDEPEELAEEPVEEDTNNYGNSVGNLYNNGYYVEYKDGTFLVLNDYGQVFKIDAAEETGEYIMPFDIYDMNYSDGILYGILDTENEELKEFNGDIAVIEIDEENSKISENFIENRKPADICVVNGVIYYSDKVSHKFLSYNPETDEETVLVDDKVYYPIIYKDLAVFQNASDGESLYSVSLDSGEITKLNDTCSYWPIVYKDKIYYQGLKDAAYTLRCMKLDGTADMELAGLEFETPVICGNKLCFVDLSVHRVVSFLDLENPDAGIQKLDIEAQLLELMMKDEYIISSGEDLSSYKLNHVSKLSYINGCLVFDTLYKDENGDYFADDAMYNFDTGEVSRFPWDYIK